MEDDTMADGYAREFTGRGSTPGDRPMRTMLTPSEGRLAVT